MYRRIVHPTKRTYLAIPEDMKDKWSDLIPWPEPKYKKPAFVWAFTELGWEIVGEETFRCNKLFSVIEFPEYIADPYDEIQVVLSVSYITGDKREYNKELRQVFAGIKTFSFNGISYEYLGIFSGNIFCKGKVFLAANFDRLTIRGNKAIGFEEEYDNNSYEMTPCIMKVSGDISTEISF